MTNIKKVVFIFLFISNTSFLFSQDSSSIFIDPYDNAFDISHYLYNLNGLLPVVSPITEPAVGYGAAVAALYFIPKEKSNDDGFKMPDIVGIAGGYTENGTWFAGGGYVGFWNKDKVRYRGVLGYGDVNLTFYANGNSKFPVKFTLNSYIFLQQALFRLGESNFFLGGKYQLTKIKVSLLKDGEFSGIKPRDFDLWNSGISAITEYENYNNILSPTKGIRINFTYDQNLEILGSDKNFGRLTYFTHLYTPINKTWIPAFRVESLLSTGDAPFYALPFVSLRGIPALRYQGELTVLVETEHAFNLSYRWGLVGFAGVGTAFKDIDKMNAGDTAWNAGGGIRYLIARSLGLKMGVDVARGPEDWALYVVFGSSWMK